MPSLQLGPVRNSVLVRETIRIAPVRPDLIAGVRAGLATTLPLVLASLTQRPELAWTSLAGFQIVLVDKGGAYRTRAESMFMLALANVLVIPLGMLVADHAWLAVPLTLLVLGCGGFMRLFGAEASAIGVMMSVSWVVALSRPLHSVHEALSCAGFSFIGSVWAAGIGLFLWPVRVYRPARAAVAHALRSLVLVAQSFVDADSAADAQVERRVQLGAARTAIENARASIAASRRSRPGPTRIGEQLVALLEASDQLFAALVALEDSLAHAPPLALPKLRNWIERAAALIARELTRIADALEHEGEPSMPHDDAGAGQLMNSIAPAQAQGYATPRILTRALERLDAVIQNARALADDPLLDTDIDTALVPRASRTEPSDLSTEASKSSLLRDNLTLDSAMFRHALRMSITTALTLLLVRALGLEHGYWSTLTCLVIMQPHGSATWTKALQRVLGTILGAVLASLVASVVREPLLLTLCVFGFVGLGVALLPLNYGVFAVFLTPGFVLLAETHAGHADLAGARVANTLLGATIALLGSRLLFPVVERDQLRPLMAAALRQLSVLLEVAASPQPSAAALAGARRDVGLALLNAEASYQRLITETGVEHAESEALLTLLLYVHRLASGLIALAVAEGSNAHRSLRERKLFIGGALTELTAAIAEQRDPAEFVEGSAPDEPNARIDRLFDQLAVLRSALLRWHGRS